MLSRAVGAAAAAALLHFSTSSALDAPPSSPFPTCTLSAPIGCFNDTAPRVAGYLTMAGDTSMTVESCAHACAVSGFRAVAATGQPGKAFCYCDVQVNPGAHKVDTSLCNVPCPGNSSETCGGVGFSLAWQQTCDGPLPPAPVGPPLKPGRACSQPEAQGWPFCNPALPLEQRVADLVGRVALPEIGPQLTSRASPPIPRLGLPGFYWGTNAIHGIAGSNCRPSGACPTSWPDGVAMAATWNESSWRLMGAVTGREMRALDNLVWSQQENPGGGLTAWGPTVNVLRDTRWGRSQESASECPVMGGKYGQAVAQGLQQGEDPRYLLAVATLKHLAAYSLEDYDNSTWKRQTFNAVVSPFDLADTYLPVFERAIKAGGAAGVMYAANALNGVPCAGYAYLDQLLHEWGFNGYRCTDGGQINNMVVGHKYVPTLDQAIGLAVTAESDIADGSEYSTDLVNAVVNGNTTLAGAQVLLANVMRIRFRLGQFDPPEGQTYLSYGEGDINDAQARAGAALASREALVLLKNTGRTLPLSRAAVKRVAVIGPHANDTETLAGNYAGAYCPNGPHGPVRNCFPTIYTSIASGYAPGSVYVQGCAISSAIPGQVDAAVAAVAGSDAVVLVLGSDQTIEAEQHDRFNMTLPDAQMELYTAVAGAAAAAGVPVIVVLIHGGTLVIPEIKANASAIMTGFYPGVTAGPAIADALFGAFSPGGRSPYTWVGPEYQNAYNFTDMSISRMPGSNSGRTYRYYPFANALWPFGHGLSYTQHNLTWSPGAAPPPAINLTTSGQPFIISVRVANTGGMDGDDVLQMYYSPVPGSLGPLEPPVLPVVQLCSFKRVAVPQGGFADVQLAIDPAELLVTGTDNVKRPLPGHYVVSLTDAGAEAAASAPSLSVRVYLG